MDFTFTEEQETIANSARDLSGHRATPEHLIELESGDNSPSARPPRNWPTRVTLTREDS